MSAETLEAPAAPRASFSAVVAGLHRPRSRGHGGSWPADPLLRLVVRLALALPFVAVAGMVLAGTAGSLATPNGELLRRASRIAWDRADPSWLTHLYPPITTVIAAVVPFRAAGLTVLGALVAGVLLHAVIEGMRERGFAVTTVVVFAIALAANPLFVYTATENLPAFIGIGLFGLGIADLVRFTTQRDTQSGFRAGILLMLAALSDPSGLVYVVIAGVSAPLFTAGRARAAGAGLANTLVVLFPTLSAFIGVVALQWLFQGQLLGFVGDTVSIDPARLAIIPQIFTTPIGWLWLATMGGTWAIALLVKQPGAVLITFLLFAAIVGGYLLGLVPTTAAGLVYMMMMLTTIGILPAAVNGRLTILVNLVGVLELVLAWLQAFNRPFVLEWLQTVFGPFLHA